VRGRFRWAQNCSRSESLRGPLTLASLDLSPHAGRGGNAQSFPRRDRARVLPTTKPRDEATGNLERAVPNCFADQATKEVLLASLPARLIPKSGVRFSDQDHAQKRRQNADRRAFPTSAPCGRGARPSGRAACRRSTAALRGASQRPRSSFRRTSWDVAEKRVLSVSACPSPAIWSQTGHRAGRAFSRSRPGAECIAPPAGTALAPLSGVPSAEGVLH
jgi:hypothetical protein